MAKKHPDFTEAKKKYGEDTAHLVVNQ